MKKNASLLLIMFLFNACSHYSIPENYSSEEEYFDLINKRCENVTATIHLIDGEQICVRNFTAAHDSSRYIINDTVRQSIPTKDIHKIIYKNRIYGLLKGAFLGASLGGSFMLINRQFDIRATFELIVLAGTTITGGIVGLLCGDSYVFIINDFE